MQTILSKASLAPTLALGLFLPLTLAAQTRPAEFSLTIPVSTSSTAPYYRVTLPLAAYLHSANADLRDIRVFNSAGQTVPFARLTPGGNNEESKRHEALRWFPLYASSVSMGGDKSLSLVVRQSSDGTLVELNSRKREAPADNDAKVIKGYVLDASKLIGPENISALDIDWGRNGGANGASADSNFQMLDVEASADLQNWRTVRIGVQLARLEFQGALIERKRIDLNGLRKGDRYLRLLWREPGTAPQLTAALIEQTTTRWQSAPPLWSDILQAAPKATLSSPSEFTYHLPHSLPVSALRFQLPAGNVLLPIDILRPGRERQPAQLLAHAVLYSIENKGRQWTQNEVVLPAQGQNGTLDSLLIRVDPRSGSPTQPLSLSVAVNPEQLIFLASGKLPFTLAIGNKTATHSALEASTLIPGFGTPQAPEIADAVAVAASEPGLASLPAESADVLFGRTQGKTIALWSVLALGVLAMGGMAFHLMRQIKENPPTEF